MKKKKMICKKNKVRREPEGFVVLGLLLLSLLLGFENIQAEYNDLFKFVTLKESDMNDQQLRVMSFTNIVPTTRKTNIVQIQMDLSKQTEGINLNLFKDVNIPLSTTKIRHRAPKDYSWFGWDKTANRQAIIVVKDKDMVGTVRADGKLYKIKPMDENHHIIILVAEDSYPPDHPPGYHELEKRASLPKEKIQSQDLKDDGSIITVLVAYTHIAKIQAGNIEALIQLAIDETNQSYFQSQINCRLELVFTYQVDYLESGDMVLDRDYFCNNGDNYMDEVHVYRDKYSADIAILISGSGEACGIACKILADESNAFAVVAQNCATGYYSFGHEIGHLQGARHNLEVDNSNEPFKYGHGYYHSPNHWRTIMSYNCPEDCERIPLWSNPHVYYEGVPVGTVDWNFNAKVLNLTKSIIANFRQSQTDNSEIKKETDHEKAK